MNNNNRPLLKKESPFGSLFIYILVCLLIGFVAGEIMGWVLVAQSNKILLTEQQWLEEKGYIAIPGSGFRPEMESWKTYFSGGLFFGLSIGLCYTFIWSLLFWVLLAWPKIRKSISIILLGLFPLFYIFTPKKAHYVVFGLFLISVPLLLLLIISIFRFNKKGGPELMQAMPYMAGFLGSIIIVSILIAPSLTGRDFVRIRDGLFGRIKWGRQVSDFYYHYTLYPARVIKTFDQKLQRFLRIDTNGFTEKELKRLKRVFIWRDIFIGEDAPSDSLIKKEKESGKIFIICSNPMFSIETPLKEFFKNPKDILKEYNRRTDSAAFLRRSVGWSLFQIWPLMGILLIYSFLIFICHFFFKKSSSTRDALLAFFSILLVITSFRYLMMPKNISSDTERILAAMKENSSGNKITAIMALWERIEKDKKKARYFSEYFIKMLDDPDPIIRKWGIDFLTQTGEKKAIKILISLLEDPDPSVAYHAARSLGKFRAREARDPLLKILVGNRGWYLKTTAYIALREIGWSQLSLKRNPIENLYH